MSGCARVATLGSEPDRTPTTRLRLVEAEEAAAAEGGGDEKSGAAGRGAADPLTLHVACMTLLHSSDEALWRTKRAALGPDPLRADADPEVVFANMLRPRNAKKGIGLLLMSQDVIAGVGNIYRAEICHLSRVRERAKKSSFPAFGERVGSERREREAISARRSGDADDGNRDFFERDKK